MLTQRLLVAALVALLALFVVLVVAHVVGGIVAPMREGLSP